MDNLRIIQFPEAGEGVTIFFRNRNILQLQETFGAEYQQIVVSGLLALNTEVIEKCLEVAAKKDGNPVKVTLDDLDDHPLTRLQEVLIDGFSLCLYGRTYENQIKYVQEEMSKMAGDKPDSPPLNPGASSGSSEEQPSGQE